MDGYMWNSVLLFDGFIKTNWEYDVLLKCWTIFRCHFAIVRDTDDIVIVLKQEPTIANQSEAEQE